jgi:cytidylate kinase
MSKITIAIDGFSSCGKSTLAKALASRLNYEYIDSGAMYRCVALHCLNKGIIKNKKYNELSVIESLAEIEFQFQYNSHTKVSETYMNGVNVEKEIRSLHVAEYVSKISMIKEVRQHLVAAQRSFGLNKGVVMDGRDIGTHVFPNAELKLFMTADIDTRIQRRVDELNSKGQHVDFDEVKTNLLQRDHDDTHRKESPLIKANDAIELDNTDLSKEEQLEFVLKLISDLYLTRD